MTEAGTVAGLRVRRALAADHAFILALVEALDLGYPAMNLGSFWVAESNGALVAAAELREYGSCSLLSCVGVSKALQGRGIGRALVDSVVRQTRSPVYLYTLVPEFFHKAGFREATALTPDLPLRSIYGCSSCVSSLCRCLVRFDDGS